MRHSWFRWTILLLLSGVALGATPPTLIHYQGVLRNASDAPVAGNYNMVFRFFDAETAGNEILLDRHLTAAAQAVTVTGGLFTAALGGGEVLDGAGPGTYTSLADVFRDHDQVWLSVQIEAETLAPRTRVLAAAYAHNAANFGGRSPSAFLDTSAAAQTKAGSLAVEVSDASAYVGSSGYGVIGYGDVAGGFFRNAAVGAEARLGYAQTGITAYGRDAGAYIADYDNSGHAYVGWGDYGIQGFGNAAGGFFRDLTGSGHAHVGSGDYGIQGLGNEAGGVFRDLNSSGNAYVGWEDYGIQAFGNEAGGFFRDLNGSGNAYVGWGDYGIQGFGNTAGGFFRDLDGDGYASVGVGFSGIQAFGSQAGGEFTSLLDGNSAWVGYGTYKIIGNGAVSFVQNHPYERDKVIVYVAPEGDEVATYTRGSGKLVDGVARVALGPTFAWVTNPDIGLTAHLTVRGPDPVALAVDSLTTSEIVVRGPAGADAAFDFLVFGLRIGFEEVSIVQEKRREAWIPSMSDHRAMYEKKPELRAFNALERFEDVAAKVNGTADVDHSRGTALRAAIQEYDPAVHGPMGLPEAGEARAPAAAAGERSTRELEPERAVEQRERPTRSGIGSRRAEVRMPVAEAVEAGDLLVLDAERPGFLRRAASAADPGVVGIAAGALEDVDGQLGVALVDVLYGVVRADAGYGAIRPGDLLTASATPGHAMRAAETLSGTVIGKALEPLESGTGPIRVLVLPR